MDTHISTSSRPKYTFPLPDLSIRLKCLLFSIQNSANSLVADSLDALRDGDDARRPCTLQCARLRLPITQHTRTAAPLCLCPSQPAGLVRPSRSTSFSNLHVNSFAFVPGAVPVTGFASRPSTSALHSPRASLPEFDDEHDFGRDSDDDSGEYSSGQYYVSSGTGGMGDGVEEKVAIDMAAGSSRNNVDGARTGRRATPHGPHVAVRGRSPSPIRELKKNLASLQSFSPPKPKFGTDQIPDLTGHVMIVTGGYAGVGKETVKHSAEAQTDREALFLELDLADLAAVCKSAQEFLSKEHELHVLFSSAVISSGTLFRWSGKKVWLRDCWMLLNAMID
ncbi:hypothetical protein A0H81_14523 [Grifola frondosa]|uniref:Uncharacterized protein n=1 Tax=Grifola frondosa TaxID=5627 RepID=A0A1C7LKX1_GRIFR|nr:hypothetical protein A0H81_14523 [Grifola frondosa]